MFEMQGFDKVETIRQEKQNVLLLFSFYLKILFGKVSFDLHMEVGHVNGVCVGMHIIGSCCLVGN